MYEKLNVIWLPYLSVTFNKQFIFQFVCLVYTIECWKYNNSRRRRKKKTLSQKCVFLILFFFGRLFFSWKGTTDYHLPCFTSSSSFNFIQMIVSEEQRMLYMYMIPGSIRVIQKGFEILCECVLILLRESYYI